MPLREIWKEHVRINLNLFSNSFKFTITEMKNFLNNPRFDLIVN